MWLAKTRYLLRSPCSEQFENQSKTQRTPPMRADRFSRVKSSANDRNVSTTRRRRRRALRSRPLHRSHKAVVGRGKSAPPTKHPSLIKCPKRIASLILPRKYRFRNKERNDHPRTASSTLQNFQPSDYFSKGDIILTASHRSYRSLIWST